MERATPRRILVVEDNASVRQMLVDVLTFAGHRVDAADEGAAGVERAMADPPEVVLTDVNLPGIDGYEVAKRLRRHFGRRLLLIALTTHGDPDDFRRSVEAGIDLHLVKPVGVGDLTRAVAQRAS